MHPSLSQIVQDARRRRRLVGCSRQFLPTSAEGLPAPRARSTRTKAASLSGEIVIASPLANEYVDSPNSPATSFGSTCIISWRSHSGKSPSSTPRRSACCRGSLSWVLGMGRAGRRGTLFGECDRSALTCGLCEENREVVKGAISFSRSHGQRWS